MKNWIVYLWFSVGIAALILSIFDFSNGLSNVTVRNTTSDNVLSILVTFLVAWQIWQTISIKDDVSKIQKLEDKLNEQIAVSDLRNQELFDIAEAHRLERIADNSKINSVRYGNYLRAMMLFLKSNVALSYPPLSNKISMPNAIITTVNNAKGEDKVSFANQMSGFDETYSQLLDVIAAREDNLKDLKKRVIRLRDRRKRLFDGFVTTPNK